VQQKERKKMKAEIQKTKIRNQVKKRRFKTVLLATLVLALGIGVLAGCGSAGKSGNITIAGSTSVQPLSEALAKSYEESNSKVKIDVQGGGSGQATKSLDEGIAQIGALSRELESDEKDSVSKKYIIAMDGVAVVVNKNVKVSDLSLKQLKGIYTGKITNWSEVGGSNAKIAVISREEGSGTREAFTEKTGVLADNNGNKTDNTTKDAVVQPSTGAVSKTVASTPNAIGYVSLASVNNKVKELKVEGVAPSEKTVLDKTYKIQRPFIYAVGKDVDATTQAFIDWVMSKEGQAQVKDNGFIPIDETK